MSVKNEIEDIKRRLTKLESEVKEIKSRITEKKGKIEISFPILIDNIEKSLKKELGNEFKARYERGMVIIAGHVIDENTHAKWDDIASVSELLDINPKRVAYLSEILSNEARVLILRALYEGSKTAKELSEITKLEGGQLYHHLRTLIQHRVIFMRRRGEYYLTSHGIKLLFALSLMARDLVPPLEEEIKKAPDY